MRRVKRTALVLAGLVVISVGLVAAVRSQPFGLQARYYRGSGCSGSPAISTIDGQLAPDTLAAYAAALGERYCAIWDGFLFAPANRSYVFSLRSDDGSRLYVDGMLVVDNWGDHAPLSVAATQPLESGPHRVRVEYRQSGGRADLELRWDAQKEGVLERVRPHELSPARIGTRTWRLRPRLVFATLALALAWSVLVASLAGLPAARWLLRRLRADPVAGRLAASAIGASLVLSVVGIWWGLPGQGWAPDELMPIDVLLGLRQSFAHGWTPGKYPPGHIYLLAVVYAPFAGAAKAGLLELTSPDAYAVLWIVARAVSVVMATAIIALAYLTGRELYGARAGAFAALVLALTVPLSFYAKTANLDVPYVAWFALAFWFYARIVTRGHQADYYGYAVAMALAIGTKDQAYALLLLPSLHIAWLTWRAGRSARDLHARPVTRLLGPAAAGVLVLAGVHNLPFNFSGFVTHVREILGPASSGYRAFDPGPTGQLRLLADILPTFRWMFGWSGLVLIGLGCWRLSRRTPSQRHLWILWPVASYYVTFVAVVGYHYDRFFLPVAVVLSLFGGLGLEWLLDRGGWAAARRALASAAIAVMAWRALSVDAMMLNDSRYDVERWLHGRVEHGATVAWEGNPVYLPRLQRFDARYLAPSIADTQRDLPRFIVVNTQHSRRYEPGSGREAWWTWLQSEQSPYRIAYRRKNRPAWSALSYEERLYQGVDDPLTTIGKINPEIVVFERRERLLRERRPAG